MSRVALIERARRRFGGSETAPPRSPSLSLSLFEIHEYEKYPTVLPAKTLPEPIRTEELFWYALRLPSIAKELVRFLRSFEALVGYAS
jgi:hypothetical protein